MNRYDNNKDQNTVSSGEMFVGLNLLSKIGVIFIIIGVIAFSAASADYIEREIRMALVYAVGAIMLIAGEIFYRKKSVVFANALILGGTAELFISVLIGRYGFGVFNSEAAQFIGLLAAAIGFSLSLRYKSQPLAITTAVFAVLPIFAVQTISSVIIGAACLVAVHAFSAVIAYRNNYAALSITGGIASCFEALIVYLLFAAAAEGNFKIPTVFTLIFLICTGFVYISGSLINAVRFGGALPVSEITVLILTQSFLVVFAQISARFVYGKPTAIVILSVMAVIYLICAVGYSLKFTAHCTISDIFVNLLLGTVSFAVITLISGSANYYALHILAAAVLISGVIVERKMLRIWGYVLLGTAEYSFFKRLVFLNLTHSDLNPTTEKIILYTVNLVIWFGIMTFYILKKKTKSVGFKLYACLCLANAGFLGSILILDDLSSFFLFNGMSDGLSALLSLLICSTLWLVLGFAAGKLKPLGKCKMPASISFYIIGLIFLGISNLLRIYANAFDVMLDGLMITITIIVNLISVLTVLDLTLQITEKAPKFAKAVGLAVSLYGVMTLTTVLGTNNAVKFSSYIISIIYIVTAALWIFIGFKKQNTLLRRFGLALSLLASGKLFLFDFIEVNNMVRTLLFIGFGITLLGIGFGYGIAEKKLKENNKK